MGRTGETFAILGLLFLLSFTILGYAGALGEIELESPWLPTLSNSVQTALTSHSLNDTVVSTELINYYSMTSSEINKLVTIISEQGLTEITLRLNAMNEFQSGPNRGGVEKTKQLITAFQKENIVVNVDLHTWYTTWDNYFRDSARNHDSYRAQYITYVKQVISAFNGYNVQAWMVLNEPQARKASSSENQFILDILEVSHGVTNSPVSVRFMGGYSPDTGHYSRLIDEQSDFLCRNVYWDPRNPSRTVYGVNINTMVDMVDNVESLGKQLWITEFGLTKSNLNSQEAYIEAFIDYAYDADISKVFAWVCQPDQNGEKYNLLDGYVPAPAFYVLVNEVDVN